MIKNLIFDLGNVLLRYKPLEYLHTKVSDKNRLQQLYNEIFLSEEWKLLDRGTITETEAIDRMVNKSTANRELIPHCMDSWYELLTPITENIDTLKQVKAAGYKTYILSNFHLLAYENVTSRYDFFRFFDGGVISCKENLLKPEPEIYNKLIRRYNLNPRESLFIDDVRDNTYSAEILGFETITFDGSANLQQTLVALGVLQADKD